MGVGIEDDRSRFRFGVGVEIEGVRFAEPGRGGGCMGVCLVFAAREDPDRASVGVWGSKAGIVVAFPFWASCATSSAR